MTKRMRALKRATTTKKVMATATATWVEDDEEGDGDGGRSSGEGNDVDRLMPGPIKRYILFLIGKKCLALSK